MRRRPVMPLLFICNLVLSSQAFAGVDYLREVKPILAARCWSCHGGLKQKADLRLDTVAFMREGGKHGSAIAPGKSGASLLIDRVTGRDGAKLMPPRDEGEPLPDREIALLRAWIDQGAIGPADEKAEADPRDHWAFRPPVRPAIPAVFSGLAPSSDRMGQQGHWVSNPIDAFIASEREKHGLKPQPSADKRLLLRRVYLDLIGVPPSTAEIRDFLTDDSPTAYEKVVDRLLASKQYGERWGRHWMDIWRYSDWWGLGAEVRNSQKHIWHWRDWIIDSLNADKGYDQMIREMLAADELYPTDLDRLRATGYLARHYFKFNRNTWLDETVEHTSKAFLGLTLNCARCHEHKYDPFPQKDYYRFRAFFEPYQVRMEQLPGEPELEKNGLPRVFDCNLEAATYLFVRGDDKQPAKDRPITPGVPELLAIGDLDIQPVKLLPEAHSPGLRQFVLEDQLRIAERQIQAARQALEQAKKTAAVLGAAGPRIADAVSASERQTPEQARAGVGIAEKTLAAAEALPLALRARAAADRAKVEALPDGRARELARAAARAERQAGLLKADEDLARAELDVATADAAKKPAADKKLAAARDALARARKALETPGESYTPLRGALKTLESNLETEASRSKPFPTTSTGRRSALARWMTDLRQPLTARVAVNHIWARHFGKPLVPTVFEFGRKGSPPTHPALLDWLAVELRENQWSMKHLHRLIVTSSTYRMTSSGAGADPANAKLDPENRWYWRMNSLRMEAQVIRDSLLSLAGDLDLTMGGPSIPVTDETSRRRSLYFVHSHNEHQKFLAMFDDASVLECYRRSESIVPQQALALENSKLALSTAARIVVRLDQHLGQTSSEQFVRAAFEMVLGSEPTAAERKECEQALAQLTKSLIDAKLPDVQRRVRTTLVQALLNHNDFVTIR